MKEYWTAYNAVQRALERLTATMASDHRERNHDAILTELRSKYGGGPRARDTRTSYRDIVGVEPFR